MKRIIIVAASFLVVFLIVLAGLRPTRYDIAAGRTAPADIYAKREIVDKRTTEKRKAEAEADLQARYDISEDLTKEATEKLNDIFAQIDTLRATPYNERSANPTVDDVSVDVCLYLTDAEYDSFRRYVKEVQETLLEEGIIAKADALAAADQTLRLQFNNARVECAVAILTVSMRENKIVNAEKTEEARQKLRDSVEDVTLKAGQVIVRKGDIVTQAQYELLAELGMVKTQNAAVDFKMFAGAFVLLISCFAALYLYMRQFSKEYLKNDGMLLLVAIIFVLTVLMSTVGLAENISRYILPVITGAALLAILVDVRFALTYNAILSLLCTLVCGGDMYFLVCLLLTGSLAVFLFTRANARHNLVFSALLQSLANMLIYFGIALLEGAGMRDSLLRGAYGFGAGAITSVLVIGTLPFWEYAFDVTTPYKLLELANPNQPLLKRLLTEAPGTYHHSLMVGNLAEAACEAVGGNPLLARTGAYYHDVGKLKRPQYFKENQYAENPHDKMSPFLSATMIISHVKDGMDLARQYRLPGTVRSIIATHHGNSLAAFFYCKAQVENAGDVEEEKFRYPGPRPHSREEALVLLADSVEAAVRSLDDKGESSVATMVHKIVQGKLEDDQLNKSGLTLRDIETAEHAFVKVFCGYFHSRIQYPDVPEKPRKA